MKYVTREINGYIYNMVKVEKDNEGNTVVTNTATAYSPRKLGARAQKAMLEDNDCNVVVSIDETKENRRMSIETFMHYSEPYDKTTANDEED